MTDRATVRDGAIHIERLLPGPIERVWSYIVDPDKRALWFAGGAWDLHPGGEARVVFDHSKVSDEPIPEEWKGMEGNAPSGTITRVEAPRLLAYRADMGGAPFEVTFELTAVGDEVILALTQAPVDDQGKAAFGAGWHAYLDMLEDRLRGVKPRAFWTRFKGLMEQYATRF